MQLGSEASVLACFFLVWGVKCCQYAEGSEYGQQEIAISVPTGVQITHAY